VHSNSKQISAHWICLTLQMTDVTTDYTAGTLILTDAY